MTPSLVYKATVNTENERPMHDIGMTEHDFKSKLRETTWCLIGFHGNDSQINDVTGGRHLGFYNFQILFKFEILYFKMKRKQYLVVEIHKIIRIHYEVVSI